MLAVPVTFSVGPLTFHLYGFGLAVAAYVTYRYGERRLRHAALSTAAWSRVALVAVVAGLVGARLAHVLTNWSYYQLHPTSVVAVWQGGLSSFGGIALAAPLCVLVARRSWPATSLLILTDALLPALVAGWALGRVLGPQFMYAGGGHLTHQWFGLHYVGQYGKRVPVPLIQGAEDALLWLGLLVAQRRVRRVGTVTALALSVWGVVRTLDEHFLLDQAGHAGSLAVQVSGLVLFAGGLAVFARRSRLLRPEMSN